MDRKDHNFGKKFKEYREAYLDIKQLEDKTHNRLHTFTLVKRSREGFFYLQL